MSSQQPPSWLRTLRRDGEEVSGRDHCMASHHTCGPQDRIQDQTTAASLTKGLGSEPSSVVKNFPSVHKAPGRILTVVSRGILGEETVWLEHHLPKQPACLDGAIPPFQFTLLEGFPSLPPSFPPRPAFQVSWSLSPHNTVHLPRELPHSTFLASSLISQL